MSPTALQRHRVCRRGGAAAMWLAAAVGIAGCGGGDFAVSADVARKAGTRIEAPRLARGLHIPADEPFNVIEPIMAQHTGAKSVSTAVSSPQGTGECEASAEAGGSAQAQLQFGHKIEMPAATGGVPPGPATPVVVRLDVAGDVEHARSGDDPDTTALAEVWVYIRNSRGMVLRKETLVSNTEGASRGDFARRPQFELMLEPDMGYFIMIGARTKATALEKEHASAKVSITKASLDVTPAGK